MAIILGRTLPDSHLPLFLFLLIISSRDSSYLLSLSILSKTGYNKQRYVPGGARKSQEEPIGAGWSRVELGGAKVEPGGAQKSQVKPDGAKVEPLKVRP